MTSPPEANKAELRRRFRAARNALPQPQVDADSESIRHLVLGLDEVQAAQTIFVYASTASEVQTYLLIEDLIALRKTVAVPRITDPQHGVMEAVVIRSLKDLSPAPEHFGLLTPRGGQTLDRPADVVLVPGLAFSSTTGVRLGMGGGYYDRYLAWFGQTADWEPPGGRAVPQTSGGVVPQTSEGALPLTSGGGVPLTSGGGGGGLRIGLAFDLQIEDDLPREAHDQTMHLIVTPRRVHRVAPPSA